MDWFFWALGSALGSAVAAVCEKKVLFSVGAFDFSVALAVVNGIIALPFLFFVPIPGSEALILLGIKSILGALAFLFVMKGLRNDELSGVLPLLVLTPGLVAFFAWLLLGEVLSVMEIMGLVLLSLGVYVLQFKKGKWGLQSFKRLFTERARLFIGTALLLFTVSSIMDKLVVGQYHVMSLTFLVYQHIIVMLVFLIARLFKGTQYYSEAPWRTIWYWVVGIAVLSLCYRYLQIEAVKQGPVALVLAVKRTSVFMAAVIGGTLFKERDLIKRWIGTLIMILGALLIILNDKIW